MDRAIAKASKIITTKSITAKPDRPKRQLSQKETDFFNRREYNKWVIESYLLMGKAHFYKHDFPSAIKTFQFMLNEYPENPVIWPTQIWLARAFLETGRYRDAKLILDKMTSEKGFPESLKGELNATLANYYLKQNENAAALPYLLTSLDNTKDKSANARFTYLIAQLYGQSGNESKAAEYFGRVLKMSPPYEMVFNAQINMALMGGSGISGDERTEASLNKMLRDEKNREFEDQIYFALGNIALRSGEEMKAMDYFQRSSETGNPNSPQKVVTSLTLAEIALKKPDYVKASEHFEKAAALIRPDYPGYESIIYKSKNLGNLAGNIRVFKLEDSVQVLATMNENERNQVIDKIIAQIRQAEDEARNAEMLQRREQQEKYMRTAPVSQMQAGRQETSLWYFYNQATVNFGINEFEALWGKRRLEDNWRRSNRLIMMQDQTIDLGVASTKEDAATAEDAGSPTSREYYIRNIPLTPEQLEKSHKRIEEALFNMGKIFKNDITDPKEAVWSYEELNRRYPYHERMAEALYDLHELNLLTGNFSRAEYYKNQVVQRYPNTQFAGILSNPNYFRELQEQEDSIERLYQETFALYQNNRFAEVLRNADYAIQSFPQATQIPQFMLIRAISINQLGDATKFRLQLSEIIEKFPGTAVQESSKELLTMLDLDRPYIAQQLMAEKAREMYSETRTGKHFVVFAVINDQAVINQLVFNLINFNIDYFNRLNLQITTEDFTAEEKLLKIVEFSDLKRASDYYVAAITNPEIRKDIPEGTFRLFFISENNLTVMQKDKSFEKYLRFFESQILKN